jgi:hypothetical protein
VIEGLNACSKPICIGFWRNGLSVSAAFIPQISTFKYKTDNGNKAANITHATKYHQKSPVIDRQSPVEKEDDDFMPTYPPMEEVRN